MLVIAEGHGVMLEGCRVPSYSRVPKIGHDISTRTDVLSRRGTAERKYARILLIKAVPCPYGNVPCFGKQHVPAGRAPRKTAGQAGVGPED